MHKYKFSDKDPTDPDLIIGEEDREDLSQFDSSFIFDRSCKHTWTFGYENDYSYKKYPANLLEENWEIARGRWIKKCMGCGAFGRSKYTYFNLEECVDHDLEDNPLGVRGVKRCKQCERVFNEISSDTQPGENVSFLEEHACFDDDKHVFDGDLEKLSTKYLLEHGY